MYVYLSKILPLLVLPLGVCLVLLLLALGLLLAGRRKIAGASLFIALLMLWGSSTPWVAEVLYARLESHYPPLPLADVPETECILLLGGAVGLPISPRVDIELSEAVDRVYKAAQLYRAGKARVIIVAAGNQPWSEPGPSEAALIGELLAEWGVPPAAIRLEGSSRNTRENALNAVRLVELNRCSRPLLVTSAAHMPRAKAAFDALAVNTTPVSTDVRVIRRTRYTWLDFIPDAGALAMTSAAVREWLGQKVYEWQEWN